MAPISPQIEAEAPIDSELDHIMLATNPQIPVTRYSEI